MDAGVWRLLPLVVQAVGVAVVLLGGTSFLGDRALSTAFRSMPSPAEASPVVLLWHEPPSGRGWFLEGDELRRMAAAWGDDTPWVSDVPRQRYRGTAPPGTYRAEDEPPMARAEELVRELPEHLPDHVRALVEQLRSAGRLAPEPWWAVRPLVDRRRLLDASLLRWVETLSVERARQRPEALAACRGKVVVVGTRESLGGPLTFCGQVSESRLQAMVVAGAMAGRAVARTGPLTVVAAMVLVSLMLSLTGARFGRPVAAVVAVVVLVGAGPAARAVLGSMPLWFDPTPVQVMALLATVAPIAAGRSSADERTRRREALEAVRAAWAADGRAGLTEARAALSTWDSEAAAAWDAIVRQDELKDDAAVPPADLPLHRLEVEELYELGWAYERGYHWNEALMAYDWAALKRLDHRDLIQRRREAKDAVMGNLEFIDVDELAAQLDKRYERLELLGQGGMGVVLKGWDAYLERPVAVKLVMPGCLADDVARERFFREIETLGRLNHPLVVQVFNVHRDETLLYYTMELLAGRGLAEAVGRSAADCSWRRRLSVLAQLARVLAHVHDQGVLHRDLKPDNVLYVDDRGPVLIDFGIARAAEQAEGLTQAGQLLGTLAYMAPELVRGGGGGREADIFAFGVISYELATGKLPFTNPITLKARPPDRPRAVAADVPAELEALIVRAMAPEPADRPSSFLEVAETLERLSA